jgi:hypothetical protein
MGCKRKIQIIITSMQMICNVEWSHPLALAAMANDCQLSKPTTDLRVVKFLAERQYCLVKYGNLSLQRFDSASTFRYGLAANAPAAN